VELRLHVLIEDIRVPRHQRHVVAFEHRQNGQVSSVARPLA